MNSYKSREQPVTSKTNLDEIITLDEEIITNEEAPANMSDSDTSLDISSETREVVPINPEIFRRLMEDQPYQTIDMTSFEDEEFHTVIEDTTKFYEINETGSVEKKEDASTDTDAKAENDMEIIHKSDLRRRLERILLFHRDSRKPISTLLYGTPGCGKSYILEKIARQYGINYEFISTTDIKSSMHGESEANLKKIFTKASAKGPTMLVIDEIDALISDRDTKEAQSEVSAGTKNLLLNLLSGSEAQAGVFVFFTTNYPWKLDKAFRNRMTVTKRVHSPSQVELYNYFMQKVHEQGYSCDMSLQQFSEINTENWDFRRIDTLVTASTEELQIKSMAAPHLRFYSHSPRRIIGCYCNGSCDKPSEQKLDKFPCEEIRCGRITFSDIFKAQVQDNIISTADKDDVEKLNHFEKYGKIPEDKKENGNNTNYTERQIIYSCFGEQFEWLALVIFIICGLVTLILLANYGVI